MLDRARRDFRQAARGLSRRPGLVAGRGLRFVTLGLAVGLPAAYAVARAASTVLFGVTPADATTYVVAGFGLVAAGTAACLVPALRAARLDPVAILREP